MTQFRVMDDDPEYVKHILDIVIPPLQADTRLIVGTRTELQHRGGGRRVVFTVLARDYPGPSGRTTIHGQVERDNRGERPQRRTAPRRLRRQLPP